MTHQLGFYDQTFCGAIKGDVTYNPYEVSCVPCLNARMQLFCTCRGRTKLVNATAFCVSCNKLKRPVKPW